VPQAPSPLPASAEFDPVFVALALVVFDAAGLDAALLFAADFFAAGFFSFAAEALLAEALLAEALLVAALLAVFLPAALPPFAPPLLACLARISSIAFSRSMPSASSPLGSVALVLPSVT